MKVWDASSNTSPRVLATAPLGIFMNTTWPLKDNGGMCLQPLYPIYSTIWYVSYSHIALKYQWWTLNRLKLCFIYKDQCPQKFLSFSQLTCWSTAWRDIDFYGMVSGKASEKIFYLVSLTSLGRGHPPWSDLKQFMKIVAHFYNVHV